MLLSTLYHKGYETRYGNSLKTLQKHFSYIKKHYIDLLPGETIPKWKKSICLTFDDATLDFYTTLFPLLKKLNLKAVLAVPVFFIEMDGNSSQTLTDYLTKMSKKALQTNQSLDEIKAANNKEKYCSWNQLREIASSPLIEIASHSFSHVDMSKSDINSNQEINLSKQILLENLPDAINPIQTFVYPFGKFNAEIQKSIESHYCYSFRIGSGYNFSWKNYNNLLYRVPCDNLTNPLSPFLLRNKLHYLTRLLTNTLRKR